MKQFNTFFKGFNRTLVYYLEVICLKAQAQQNFRKGIQEGLLEYYKLKQRLPVGGDCPHRLKYELDMEGGWNDVHSILSVQSEHNKL